jgi:hypothetical protein
MDTTNKKDVNAGGSTKQFDPLGIFNLNIQSELYAKGLLNGESEANDILLELGKVSDNIGPSHTDCINKTDNTIH